MFRRSNVNQYLKSLAADVQTPETLKSTVGMHFLFYIRMIDGVFAHNFLHIVAETCNVKSGTFLMTLVN